MMTVAAASPTQAQEESTAPDQTEPAQGETEATEEETQPQIMPDFVVYDSEGNEARLSDFRGKPVIINFWATWCGYCVREMPDFQAAYEAHGDQIHFMMINVTDGYRETQADAEAFIAENGYTFPVYFDLNLDAGNAYYVNTMPTTYLLDAQGCFVAWKKGALSAAGLQKGVDMLLGSGNETAG